MCSGFVHAENFQRCEVLTEGGTIIYRCDSCQEELSIFEGARDTRPL